MKMLCGSKKLYILIFVFLVWMNTLCRCTQEKINLTLCYAGHTDIIYRERKYCDELHFLSKNRIFCKSAIDRLNCLEKLLKGSVDFGVFKPEDLFLALQLSIASEEDLVITHEFRTFSEQKHEFDMVTLVSNSPNVHINSLADLRGKRLCHPGFDEYGWLNDLSEIFLRYFEEAVVPEKCDPKSSVLENRVNSSDSFFDVSCKPGPWSPESDIDRKLKSRYNRLCETCNNPSECSHRDLYWGPQGAVTCILDCHGDIAWAKLQILKYSLEKGTPCQDLSYLCLDGTKQSLNTTDPCIWISRPWPVILTRKAVESQMITLIDSVNNSPLSDNSWEYALRSVLGNSLQPIQPITPISPRQYLSKVPGFLSASEKKTCRGSGQDMVIRVCVESRNNMKKCELMAKVANIYSIDPQFECVLLKECLTNIVKGEADIFMTSIENLIAVYEEKNLKVIMYQTTDDYSELRKSSAIVLNNSTIQSFSDLKGKKACFTRYNGLGWNSLLLALNDSSMVTDIHNGSEVMKEFFSDVCIIDHQSSDPVRGCFDQDDDTVAIGSLHENEANGLRCLVEGGGDVTFIDGNYIGKYLEENVNLAWTKGYENNHFRFVCRPESKFDPDCYLSIATFGMVVVRKNISADREEEIISAFKILSSLLGDQPTINKIYNYEPKLLRLFSRNYNERDSFFESSASQLETTDRYFTRGQIFAKYFYEKKLQNLINARRENKRHHDESSGAAIVMISNFVILCSLIRMLVTLPNFFTFPKQS